MIWVSWSINMVKPSIYLSPSELILFYLFEMQSHSVAQAGVQSYDLSSLQPWTLGLKQSSGLSFLNSWDYRHVPLHLANILLFCGYEDSPSQPFWSQTSGLKQSSCLGLPKCWDYRWEPLHLTRICFLIIEVSYTQEYRKHHNESPCIHHLASTITSTLPIFKKLFSNFLKC